MSLPIPQMFFGTIMMIAITLMIHDFVDPNQCNGVADIDDKQKCENLTNMIFNSVPIAWIVYVGGGIVLFLLQRNAERKIQKVKSVD